MALEYKTVGAPLRGRRKRGAKTRSDKVAAAMQEVLEREAVDGWQYLRTDLIPIEERRGWFGRAQEVHRAVMVFFRDVSVPPAAQSAAHPAAAGAGPVLTAERDEKDTADLPSLSTAREQPGSGAAPLVATPVRSMPGPDSKD
ncbi:MAG: hypothetical protein AAGD47_10640 [Pseudomonadota bacterium]